MSRNNNSRKDNRRVPVPWDECRGECREECMEECKECKEECKACLEECMEEFWEHEEYWEEGGQEMDKFWPSKRPIRKNRSASPSKSSLNTVNANKSLCY